MVMGCQYDREERCEGRQRSIHEAAEAGLDALEQERLVVEFGVVVEAGMPHACFDLLEFGVGVRVDGERATCPGRAPIRLSTLRWSGPDRRREASIANARALARPRRGNATGDAPVVPALPAAVLCPR